MRIIEIINSMPGLLFLLALLMLVQQPGLNSLIALIAFLSWTTVARFTRAEMIKIREQAYILSAKASGMNDLLIIVKHALPNLLNPISIIVAFGIASTILLEASLSFLSLGVSEETMTWGKMLSFARDKPGAWWLAIFPGICIFLIVFAFNNLAETLRKSLDKSEKIKV